MDFMADFLDETASAFAALREEPAHREVIAAMAELLAARLRTGHKLLLCGNGGSASDAQHIAGEFVGRLMFDRAPLPAVALTADGAVLTALGNDYGFEQVFARQVTALGRPGDVLLAISTSGNSPNVLAALLAARRAGLACLGFTGAGENAMTAACDGVLRAPARRTAVIQQLHITAGHALCGLVERMLFKD